MRILIIGDFYGVQDREPMERAARSLGKSLAVGGNEIVACTDNPDTADFQFVSGALESESTDFRLTIYSPPVPTYPFALATRGRPGRVRYEISPFQSWEIVHMEAIQYADIIILIGGYGKWRYVTKMLGLAAMALRKVVVPLAAFGGQARLVWDSLASSPLRDRYKEIGLDVTELNSPWREGESEALLARMMTEAYRKRSMAFEPTRQTKGNSLGVSIATAFLLFTVMAGLWVFLLLGSLYGPYPVGLAPLFGLVVLAGGIGAGTNVSYLLWRGEAMSHALQLMSLLVGVSGGMVSFILYLVGQLVFTGEVSTELPDAAALIRSGLVASFFGLFSGLFVERGYDAIRRTSESVAAELAPKR